MTIYIYFFIQDRELSVSKFVKKLFLAVDIQNVFSSVAHTDPLLLNTSKLCFQEG